MSASGTSTDHHGMQTDQRHQHDDRREADQDRQHLPAARGGGALGRPVARRGHEDLRRLGCRLGEDGSGVLGLGGEHDARAVARRRRCRPSPRRASTRMADENLAIERLRDASS